MPAITATSLLGYVSNYSITTPTVNHTLPIHHVNNSSVDLNWSKKNETARAAAHDLAYRAHKVNKTDEKPLEGGQKLHHRIRRTADDNDIISQVIKADQAKLDKCGFILKNMETYKILPAQHQLKAKRQYKKDKNQFRTEGCEPLRKYILENENEKRINSQKSSFRDPCDPRFSYSGSVPDFVMKIAQCQKT